MRRKDLTVGMVVAAKDFDGEYERAEVRTLGIPDFPNEHMVVFQTGSYTGKSRGVKSRDIRVWDEAEWWEARHDELVHEIELAQIAFDKESATDALEAIRAAMSTLDITAGIGQVVQRRPSGVMETTMALFLPVDEAKKLLPVVTDHSLRQLTT